MENFLISLAVFGSLTSALAQGQITFSAVGSPTPNYIQYGCVCHGVQKVPAGDPAQVGWYGDFNLTLYGAPVGTTLSMSGGVPNLTGPWKPATTVLHKIGPADGVVTATIFQMEPSILNAAGEFQLTVVAWAGAASNFDDAVRSSGIVGWTGSDLSGGALTWKSGSGTSTSPYVIDKGPNAYNGLVLIFSFLNLRLPHSSVSGQRRGCLSVSESSGSADDRIADRKRLQRCA